MAAAVGGAASSGPSDEGSGSKGQAPQRRRGLVEFGDERRRVTDTILVMNAACMAMQWLSRGLLTFWGAKVGVAGVVYLVPHLHDLPGLCIRQIGIQHAPNSK